MFITTYHVSTMYLDHSNTVILDVDICFLHIFTRVIWNCVWATEILVYCLCTEPKYYGCTSWSWWCGHLLQPSRDLIEDNLQFISDYLLTINLRITKVNLRLISANTLSSLKECWSGVVGRKVIVVHWLSLYYIYYLAFGLIDPLSQGTIVWGLFRLLRRISVIYELFQRLPLVDFSRLTVVVLYYYEF